MAGAMDGQRVVVTGGAGFIGVHSVEALLVAGADVLVIDDLRHASYRLLPAAARLEAADIAEDPARDAIRAWKPTAVLHLAAQGGVNRSWREPAADAHINVLGTVSILTAAIAAGCRRVVVASSGGALYGAARRLPTPEDEPTQPRSPYGTAKLCIEHYLGHFTRAGAIDALALRYGNVYGPGQDGTGEAGVVAISSLRLLGGTGAGPPRRRRPDPRFHLRRRHRRGERARTGLDGHRCAQRRHRSGDEHRRSGPPALGTRRAMPASRSGSRCRRARWRGARWTTPSSPIGSAGARRSASTKAWLAPSRAFAIRRADHAAVCAAVISPDTSKTSATATRAAIDERRSAARGPDRRQAIVHAAIGAAAATATRR